MKVSANAPCPCGRDAKLKLCCGRIHQGRPPTPEQLVRARYCAFVLGKVRFLMDTTHPQAPHAQEDRAAWRADLRTYCQRTSFHGLEVHEHEVDEEAGVAHVRFTVDLDVDGQPAGFTERSLFRREGPRWLYVSGELGPPDPGAR